MDSRYPAYAGTGSAGMTFLKMLPACAGTGFAGMTFLKKTFILCGLAATAISTRE